MTNIKAPDQRDGRGGIFRQRVNFYNAKILTNFFTFTTIFIFSPTATYARIVTPGICLQNKRFGLEKVSR